MVGLGKWKFGSNKQQKPTPTPTSSTVPQTPTTTTTNAASPTPTPQKHQNSSSTSTSSTSTSTSPPSNRLSWFRNLKPSSPKRNRNSMITRDDPAYSRLHKPFTKQNLEHQKLLGAFDWSYRDGAAASSEDDDDEYEPDDGFGVDPLVDVRGLRTRRDVRVSMNEC